MRTLTMISAAAAFAILMSGPVVTKSETPASETICDSEIGAAWGLCNAYCEAMDCDEDPQASQEACNRVSGKFISITGRALPCELPNPVTCPCSSFDLDLLQTANWGEPGSAQCRAGHEGPELGLDVIGGLIEGPGLHCYTYIGATHDVGAEDGAYCGSTLWFTDDCSDPNYDGASFISPEEVDACHAIIRQMAELLGAECPGDE